MKILNCSTWNKFKTRVFKFALCVSASLGIAFSGCSFSAFAAPAVVPVGAELIGELLVALGLMSGNSVDGFDWRIDTPAGRDIYTTDIFGNVVPKIKKGQTVTVEELKPLVGTVIPDNLYQTDGNGNFFVVGRPLTTDDLFLKAKALAGVSYGIPINIDGAQAFSSILKTSDYVVVSTPISDAVEGNDYYFVPYYLGKSGSSYILPVSIHFTSPTVCVLFDFRTGAQVSGDGFKLQRYMTFPCNYSSYFRTTDSSDGLGSTKYNLAFLPTGGSEASNSTAENPIYWSNSIITISGDGAEKENSARLDSYKLKSGTLLRTDGKPILELQGDKEKLGNAIVQVKKDDDNNGNLPSGQEPAPQSPNSWEIWKSIEDLVKFIDTGEVNNGNTDYGDFVNNNYNYVNVNIDVPDTINNNVNISGGLDVNTSGSVDITIHEDISLPSAGDGSGFFNPDATNVLGALVKDNPVISVVSGLFSAIDPALLGVFSVSVSLLLVLGLWKLIRG